MRKKLRLYLKLSVSTVFLVHLLSLLCQRTHCQDASAATSGVSGVSNPLDEDDEFRRIDKEHTRNVVRLAATDQFNSEIISNRTKAYLSTERRSRGRQQPHQRQQPTTTTTTEEPETISPLLKDTNEDRLPHLEEDRSDRETVDQPRFTSPLTNSSSNIKQNHGFVCPEQFGYYDDITDCSNYFVCVFGEALHETCTGGLYFSAELQTCDWPRNVPCKKNEKREGDNNNNNKQVNNKKEAVSSDYFAVTLPPSEEDHLAREVKSLPDEKSLAEERKLSETVKSSLDDKSKNGPEEDESDSSDDVSLDLLNPSNILEAERRESVRRILLQAEDSHASIDRVVIQPRPTRLPILNNPLIPPRHFFTQTVNAAASREGGIRRRAPPQRTTTTTTARPVSNGSRYQEQYHTSHRHQQSSPRQTHGQNNNAFFAPQHDARSSSTSGSSSQRSNPIDYTPIVSPFTFHEPSSSRSQPQQHQHPPQPQHQGSVSPAISHRFRSSNGPPPSSSINTFREFAVSKPESNSQPTSFRSDSRLTSRPPPVSSAEDSNSNERSRVLFPEPGFSSPPVPPVSANSVPNNLNNNSQRPRNYFQNVRLQSVAHQTPAPSFHQTSHPDSRVSHVSPPPSFVSRPKSSETVAPIEFDDERSPPEVLASPSPASRYTSRPVSLNSVRPQSIDNNNRLRDEMNLPSGSSRPTRPPKPVAVTESLPSIISEEEQTRPWISRTTPRPPSFSDIQPVNGNRDDPRDSPDAGRSRDNRRPYLPPPEATPAETPFGDVVDSDRSDDEPDRSHRTHESLNEDNRRPRVLNDRTNDDVNNEPNPRTSTERRGRSRSRVSHRTTTTTTTTEEPETIQPILEDEHRLPHLNHNHNHEAIELPRSRSPPRPDSPPPPARNEEEDREVDDRPPPPPPSPSKRPGRRRNRVRVKPVHQPVQPVESFPDSDGDVSLSSRGRSSSSIALQNAEKCDAKICRLPNCRCGGTSIPGGLKAKQVPQIVMITFDDAINDLNWEIYEEIFHSGRKNPNGCPPLGTFYVSHEWTDYSQVQTLYSYGHEMASHGVTHSFGEKFSIKQWTKEVQGQREILHLYGGVKLEDVRGMRAPFLQVGGNRMFQMLYESNFTYDSSMPVYENRPPFYPYTLDYAMNHECMITPCPSKSFPGLWEVGMVMWEDLNGGRCSMGDACSNPADEESVHRMLLNNFNRHYESNRAPFGLFYHSAWFNTAHHRKGFIKFLDEIMSKDDVFVTTTWQMLQWMQNPTPLSKINSFKPWSCDKPATSVSACLSPRVCNVRHKSELRFMKTCQPCPKQYPWVGNTGYE